MKTIKWYNKPITMKGYIYGNIIVVVLVLTVKLLIVLIGG